MEQTDSCQREQVGGLDERIHMHNLWTETTVWQWPEGGGWGWMEVGKWGQVGGMEDICNIVNNFKKKEKRYYHIFHSMAKIRKCWPDIWNNWNFHALILQL